MTTGARAPADERALRIFWVLIGLAVVAALAASVAGVLFWVVDPADGSTAESALGLAAAISGLSTGALFGAAAIYAQIKNLWRFAPMWFRYLAWVVLAAALLVGIVSSVVNTDTA
jgi:hypothetical protein